MSAFLPPKAESGAAVTISFRAPPSLDARIRERAQASGYSKSEAVAVLVALALDLEEALKPYEGSLKKRMLSGRLSLSEAVAQCVAKSGPKR